MLLMAMKRKPRAQLSRSGKYYRDNPDAAKRKAQTDKKINARPEQRKKRSELSVARKKLKKKGKKLEGKDLSHRADGSIRLRSVKKNRGSSSDTSGDRRARGKRK